MSETKTPVIPVVCWGYASVGGEDASGPRLVAPRIGQVSTCPTYCDRLTPVPRYRPGATTRRALSGLPGSLVAFRSLSVPGKGGIMETGVSEIPNGIETFVVLLRFKELIPRYRAGFPQLRHLERLEPKFVFLGDSPRVSGVFGALANHVPGSSCPVTRAASTD